MIEDWPEFRSMWKDLMVGYPESIQIQHMKTNLPANDAKSVAGVKTMDEMWRRLEKVYGDVDLNIITIKTSLENFTPKSTVDHKRILEVYEAIETAVTQLTNLDALQYLKDDFALMSKLVMKLPVADQRQYTQYITSASVKADVSSRWDKFWTWLDRVHESAVQASLMYLCDRPPTSKHPSSSSLKSGATCNTCGGVGHFARNCPSKSKTLPTGQSVRVNLAVTKISTQDDYKQHLQESKKQLGNCPSCSKPAHNYTRQFPFGQAEWLSNRLESCPQFLAKSAKKRGELIDKLKGCYKCTSWKHVGDQCFIKNKKNCTDKTGGTTCAGAHHKLLHGSGVAFCHKVRVVANSSEVAESGTHVAQDDTDSPPDMTQPVLLEVQSIKVHGHRAKVMFDNGSTAVLITHAFAKKAGLQGTMVTYWLVVVGHERVLRSTTMYTFHMVDNLGKRHEVQGYGIDAISEDSNLLDLEGV